MGLEGEPCCICGRGRRQRGFALGLAGRLVSIFSGFVTDEGEDSSHDVANDEFLGLCFDYAPTDSCDIINEAVDVLPSGSSNDLQNDVSSGNGAWF
jgi:hypothetical protein